MMCDDIANRINLARDIKKACKSATVREVNFRFWKEHF